MKQYINSKAERFGANRRFRSDIMSKDFDFRAHMREISPYFDRRGFYVSMMNAAFYSAVNGIVSDRYLSADLYFLYIVPCLNRMEFRKAYCDKSFYPVLFRGVRQPETVVRFASGRFFDGEGRCVDRASAEKLCLQEPGRLIVKPSIDSGEGVGVDLADPSEEGSVTRAVEAHLKDAGFVVQRFLNQHELMAKLNPTSLNTMRLFTYRRPGGELVPIKKQNFIRVGGKGAWRDNVSTGGGFAHIADDGGVCDTVFGGLSTRNRTFSEAFGMEAFRLPFYDKAVDFVLDLHSRLPYFDSIGWDVAVAEDGEPVLVEYNLDANLRSAQIVGGPMYGEYIDEVMDRVSRVTHKKIGCQLNIFDYGYDQFVQIEGPEHEVLY